MYYMFFYVKFCYHLAENFLFNPLFPFCMIIVSRLYHHFYELHSPYPVVYGWKVGNQSVRFFSVFPGHDGQGKIAVNIGKSFYKPFGMPGRRSCIPFCQVA